MQVLAQQQLFHTEWLEKKRHNRMKYFLLIKLKILYFFFEFCLWPWLAFVWFNGYNFRQKTNFNCPKLTAVLQRFTDQDWLTGLGTEDIKTLDKTSQIQMVSFFTNDRYNAEMNICIEYHQINFPIKTISTIYVHFDIQSWWWL